ncbi:hypothetical protein Pint_33494 [Pistacia integerrima]|uniref:Uncharacterized protein n=1 Tax=Pistacia integerrima TaxID=434235 RepID=A0ACC0X700_9ROSI|nr:hypothetical protein Pint_33494 [Pistacia integerrima]
MTWKEIIHLVCYLFRYQKLLMVYHNFEESYLINPFIKRLLISSQGIPLEGVW